MLDRNDIEQLRSALEKGLTLEETLASAEIILTRNELTQELTKIGQEFSYMFWQIVRDKIEEIELIESDEEKIQFITQESYKLYIIRKEKEIAEIQESEELIETPLENIEKEV